MDADRGPAAGRLHPASTPSTRPGTSARRRSCSRACSRDAGFEVELDGRTRRAAEPRRAPARATSDGPTLGLLSHVDTVLATPEEWEHDPWSGDVADGCVWGRGALDMKSQTAAEVAAAVSLAQRAAGGPKGDAASLQRRRRGDRRRRGRDLAVREPPRPRRRPTSCSTRAAGAVIPFDGRRVYDVCIAEKGVFRFKLIDRRRRRATRRCRRSATTRCSSSRRCCRRWPSASPATTSPTAPRALLEGLGRRPGRRRSGATRSRACARRTRRLARASSSRCSA